MSEQALRIDGMKDLDDTRVCFWKTDIGWMLYLPGCGAGRLSDHEVEEHGDGTISVTPSVGMDGHRQGKLTQRHGCLARGVWTEC